MIVGRREPEDTFLIYASGGMLVLWLLGMSISGFAIVFEQPWGERLNGIVLTAGIVAFVSAMVIQIVAHAIRRLGNHETPWKWEGSALVFSIIWLGVGLRFYFQARRQLVDRESIFGSPAIIGLWPFLVFFRAPIGSPLFFLVVTCFVSGGESLAWKWGHPFLGALAGFGLLLLVVDRKSTR